MTNDKLPADYQTFLHTIKARVQQAQLHAVLAVNKELVLLYWHIGRGILERQQAQGWGAKVIDRLADDLHRAFPQMKGFSTRNLKYMRAFAEAYPQEQFVQEVLAQITWYHHITLLEKVKDAPARLWYIQQASQHGWSRNILVMQIETGLFQRKGKAVTNFQTTLPALQSGLAHDALKDPYIFDFITTDEETKERNLQSALLSHIQQFLLELGVGFTFVGSNYHMEEDANLVTREQYIEMLIDASFRDAAEMESGFMSWCEQHVPAWRQQGYDETWIRQRIGMAQSTRGLHRTLKEQGLTMLEIRDELRKMYADDSELYELARARERLRPGLLRYRGNTGDLRQRYTLRVMIYETDKLTYEKFCRWSGLPVPSPESVFFEQPDTVRVVRDLSTVEELELMLAMSRYALQLFDAPESLTKDQIAPLMEAHGKQLRATFIAKHGYRPEDSTTPYVPVTIDGPQDHDAYYAKEYP